MTDSPFLTDLARTAVSVVLAILPIAGAFAIFQLWLLKLPRTEVIRIVAGTVLASVGLFLSTLSFLLSPTSISVYL